MRRTLDAGTLIGIGLVVALLITNSALTYRNTQQLDQDARWVAKTHDMLGLTANVLLAMIDAETGQRGFLVTGKDEYLKPYRETLAHWDESMASLRAKAQDSPEQLPHIKQLEVMGGEEFDLLKKGIALKQKKFKGQVQALIDAANAAKQKMDEIRDLAKEMSNEENVVLLQRQEQTAATYRFAIVTGVLTAIIGLFVIIAFVWALQRSLRIRDKTAAVVQEQRKLLSTTLSSIGDAVISTDVHGNVTLLNPVAQTLTGWSPEEAQAKPLETVFKIINEHSRRSAENPVTRVLHTGTIVGLANHTVLVAKDGTERAIDDSAAPIRNDKGKIVGVVMVFRDVTERRRTDQLIREGDERLRLALAAARMVIWERNIALDRFLISEGFQDVLGLAATANIDCIDRLFELVYPADLEKHRAILQKAVDAGQSYVSQYRIIRPDNGMITWLEERGHTVCSSPGKTERVIALLLDINDRKRNEEALQEADQRKNEFLATLAHELRNPMAAIRNALQIAQLDHSTGQSLGPVREMLDRQFGHLMRLVDDLLDVSRITRGKLELRKARFQISQAVESALETVRPLLEAAKHELTVNIPSEPLWINGDLTRLGQVLSNLLSNAVKYTPEGGHIWLTVTHRDNEAVLSVRDNGIGIPPDMLSRVFEMFTQVDRAVERTQGGLGIGLTLVRRLVQMHGGRVEAYSAGHNKGSEFIVRLPLATTATVNDATASAVEADRESDKPIPTPRRRILVVDDNADSAESLGMLLKIIGNEVRITYDGASAVAQAKEFRPDVVLLDIGLPGMNGYEVARKIKSMPGLENALLIAQTGWGQEEDRRRSTEAGFDAHLVKPLDQMELQKLLASKVSL